MKTIEERAKEYINPILAEGNDMYDDMLYSAFCDGAESEHKELTKWNSPDEIPDDNHSVLGKFTGNRVFQLVYFDHLWKEWKLECTCEIAHIIGWREIYE